MGPEGTNGGGAVGRAPPRNLEAERALLGALLLDFTVAWPEADRVGVESEEFYEPRHGEVYRRIAWLAFRGQPPDVVQLCDSLTLKCPRLGDRDDWWALLTELAAATPTAANAAYHAAQVRQAAARRKIIDSVRQVTDLAFQGEESDLFDHMTHAVEALHTLQEGGGRSRLPTVTAEAFLLEDPGDRPLLIGREVFGEAEWLTVIGDPKAGKSVLVLDAVAELIRNPPTDLGDVREWCGFPVFGPRRVLYMVGEGGRRSFHRRLRKRLAGYTEEERKRLHLWFPSPELLSVNHGPEYMALRNYVLEHGIELVVIDPLAHFHDLDENSTVDMKLVSGRLIALKEDTGAALLVVHHAKKDTMSQRRGSPKRGRGSSALSGANDGTIDLDHEGSEESDPERRMTFSIRNAELHLDPVVVELNRANLRYEVRARVSGGRPPSSGLTYVDVLEWIKDNGPSTYDEILAALDVPKRSLQRWLPDLHARGKLSRDREGNNRAYRFWIPGDGELPGMGA